MQTKYLLLSYFHFTQDLKCSKFLFIHSCIIDMLLRVAYHISSFLSCGIQKNLKPFGRGSRSPGHAGLRQEAQTQQLQSRVSKNFTLLHPPNSRGRLASYSLDLNSRDYAEFSLLPSLFPFILLLSSVLCVREPERCSFCGILIFTITPNLYGWCSYFHLEVDQAQSGGAKAYPKSTTCEGLGRLP